MAITGWTPEQVKSLMTTISSTYTELGSTLATDVESLNSTVENLWVGYDSLKGRQVLACQVDACYKNIVKNVNLILATLYNVAGTWEQAQKTATFSSSGGTETAATGEIINVDLSTTFTAPSPELPAIDGAAGGQNADAVAAWEEIINGDASASGTQSFDVAKCSIYGSSEEFKVVPTESIASYINSMTGNFDYTSSTQFGIDSSLDATSDFAQIKSDIDTAFGTISGLAYDNAFLGEYASSVSSFVKAVETNVNTFSESINNFNQLLTSAVESYNTQSTTISSSLSGGTSA